MSESELDILLVEDDADTRASLCDILELDGYSVGVAGSAKEARKVKAWDKVSIVILDRKLPDVMAEDLLPEIRKSAPRTAVIVVTGYGDMDSTVEALRHGAADYIIKPVDPEALRRSVRRILERRKIEHKLHREHELSDRMLHTADAAVAMLDLQGKILRINRFLESTSGWSLEECQGRDWFDHFLPERERERIREVFLRTASGIESSGTVNAIVTREGYEKAFRWTNTTLKDEDGKTFAILAVGIDVTELLEAQAVAVQSARLAAIGQTMTALAHESRNALQRIQAGLDILALEVDGHPDALEDIHRIGRAAKELHGLHEQIRNYAAPIHLDLQDCQLSDIWQRAWDHLAVQRAERNATLDERVVKVLPRLHIDAIRIEQVFRNLFENSLAACDDPVRIRLTCESTLQNASPAIQIRIQDSGPGLSEEQREKIFDAFFTTKSAGTGIGMSIVKRTIEAHGGTILVGDGNLEGAEFVITLPRKN